MAVSKPIRAALRDFVVSGVTPVAGDGEAALALLFEAERQGLVALLARSPGFLSTLADPARGDWALCARGCFVRGVLQLDVAARVLARLAASGLRALPLKGAAVAEWLYATAGDRPMADVDVLVLDDPQAAHEALQADGFTLVERADHAVALREARSGAVVELHRTLTSCPGFFPQDPDALWGRRETRKGVVDRAPGPPDLLIALALHAAFQHGFGLSLVQFLDFRLLLETEPDEAAVLAAAASSRAEGALLLSLAAARAVVGARSTRSLCSALEARVSPALVRRARGLEEEDPLTLVVPSRPSLSRARLALSGGRRLELVALTLLPLAWPGEPRPGLLRGALAGLQRAGRVLTREMERARAEVLVPAGKEP